jgi:hypothetical protein
LPQSGLVDNNVTLVNLGNTVTLVNLGNTVNDVTVRPPSGGVAVRYTRKHRQPSKNLSSARNSLENLGVISLG